MSSPLRQLETTSRVIKRAQYEAFEFAIAADGILVRNASHANPADHEYVVTIADGLPTECECPADENYDGACKHRVAVAIRRPILDTAVDQQLAADGGPSLSRDRPKETDDSEILVRESESENSTGATSRPSVNNESDVDESCVECEKLPRDFPCWECVRTGRRTL